MTNHATGDAPDRNHYTVVPAPWVAGCSDIGTRHHTNQDALCVAASPSAPRAVMAVSDGVSTAFGAEQASLVAAEEACSVLARAMTTGLAEADTFTMAFSRAHYQVLTAAGEQEPAACTLVAATVADGVIRIGNIGDSRAYWVGDNGVSWLLTQDDSMAQARMMLGMSREEAEHSLQAHSITRWLGRNAVDVSPTLVEFQPESPGWLVVCTDGLWNYASSPQDLSALVRRATASPISTVQLAEALVGWANASGGRDNITVAVARFTD